MLRLCILFALLAIVFGVDRSKFRTCQDTGFCRRFRDGPVADRDGQFVLDRASLTIGGEQVTARLASTLPQKQPLKLEVNFLKSGSVRVRITQEDVKRWQPTDLLLEAAFKYNAPREATASEIPNEWAGKDPSSFSAFAFSARNGAADSDVLVIQHRPLKLALYHDGVNTVTVNERNLLHYEHDAGSGVSAAQGAKAAELERKRRERHQGKEIVDYGEDGLAIYADGTREEKGDLDTSEITGGEEAARATGESFQGHFDSMPRGPRSVGVDFHFPCADDVYGLPEHSTPLSLPTTGPQGRYGDPYRLYTLDVFEYELQEPMALYGTIPVLWAHGHRCSADAGHTAGVFWFNPSESFIDVADAAGKAAHWLSESGEVDFFLMPGPVPKQVSQQFAALVGTQQLPPIFSLGYHQCRWNYRDERDVAEVNAQFEALDFPYDVVWLDIEHTDGKRYFTWDKKVFPTPHEMVANLSAVGRKLVTIVDPHIKRDAHYHVHSEATAKGLYVRTKDNSADFDGWCWPGSSSYLDFTAPHVRAWWATQFRLEKYAGSSLDVFTWNDMNEPSVFNGPEVSMPKDALSLAGVEHREWHNLYGVYMQMATQQGLVDRAVPLAAPANALFASSSAAAQLQDVPNAQKPRPFVLTRSFWAGSQRYGAMWTGDNMARWDHLQVAAPMLLSINLAGLSFAGADVGGFMGDPSAELFTRWFQAGAFTPFFRGHAHHDTKRREPWVFGEPHTTLHRQAALLRYSLLPLWYAAFFEAYALGLPAMRAMFYEFPQLAAARGVDDQWLVGDALLVKPIVQERQTSATVYLPAETPAAAASLWYDFHTLAPVATTAAQQFQLALPQVTLATIPAFVRAGRVLPRKLRVRRSASLMRRDPYTLFVAPDRLEAADAAPAATARGLLYLDDEESFAYLDGQFSVRLLSYADGVFRNRAHPDYVDRLATLDRAVAIARAPDAATDPLDRLVERVVLAGQARAPAAVSFVAAGAAPEPLDFVFDAATQTVVVKLRPVGARAAADWDVVFAR